MTIELALPAVRQVTPASCGPAALVSVLRYLGRDTCECRVMTLAGTTASAGTTPAGLLRAAAYYSVRGEEWANTSTDAVAEAVAAGRPALLTLQAWADQPVPRGGYADRWDDGHWVAVTAAGARRWVLMDPSLAGARATLTRSELESRWHDVEDDGVRYHRLALVFPRRRGEAKRRRVGRTRAMG